MTEKLALSAGSPGEPTSGRIAPACIDDAGVAVRPEALITCRQPGEDPLPRLAPVEIAADIVVAAALAVGQPEAARRVPSPAAAPRADRSLPAAVAKVATLAARSFASSATSAPASPNLRFLPIKVPGIFPQGLPAIATSAVVGILMYVVFSALKPQPAAQRS